MATHITIGDISPRVQYTGDGATLAFTYPFPIFADADMEVFEDAAPKTLSTDYTVAGAGNSSGGTVTFVTAPANGVIVTLRRDVTIERTSDFQESGEFRAKVINDELDAITAVQQQLADDIGRSIRLPDTDPAATLTLPDKAARADKFVNFDAQGNVTVSSNVALPSSLTGNALKYLRANTGETAYEFRTAAEVFTSLLATEGTGFISHVGSGVAEPRTLTGTASEIAVTNGNGVGGNPTFALPGTIALAGKTVTADAPTTGAEVATKNYVDAAIAGMSTRWTVRVASAGANIPIGSSLQNGDVVDGVTLATGDEVLLKDQTNPVDNGIYTVVASGVASRSPDFDTWAELVGMLITAQEGTANADKLFLCTSNTGGTLGTTAVTYAQITPGTGGTVTSITAGTGLTGGAITSAGTIAMDTTVVPQLGAANTFTVGNDIKTATGGEQTLSTTESAAASMVGSLRFRGLNTTPASVNFGHMQVMSSNLSPGFETSYFRWLTWIAGVQGIRMSLANGLYMTGATGGDKGGGSINAVNYYENGVLLERSNLVLIGSAVASASASLTITGLGSTHDTHLIELSDMVPAISGDQPWLRVGDSAGVDSGATDYSWVASAFNTGDASPVDAGSGADAQIVLNATSWGVENVSGGGFGGSFKLHRPGDGSVKPIISGTTTSWGGPMCKAVWRGGLEKPSSRWTAYSSFFQPATLHQAA